MDENAPAVRVFESNPSGTRRRGRPQLRWRDEVMEDLRKLVVANWRIAAKDRSTWRMILNQAQDLRGI